MACFISLFSLWLYVKYEKWNGGNSSKISHRKEKKTFNESLITIIILIYFILIFIAIVSSSAKDWLKRNLLPFKGKNDFLNKLQQAHQTDWFSCQSIKISFYLWNLQLKLFRFCQLCKRWRRWSRRNEKSFTVL